MEQFKGTPGPWKAHKLAEPVGYAEYEIQYSDEGECVAEVVHREADAKLIAAAPELLGALQGVIRVADRSTDEFDRAKAVINKALGKENQ